jgi:hypothetical protein
MPLTFSRVRKFNHADTVLYEIDMLRFTATKLSESDWKEPRDAWVYLESFLVHYRSLLHFFGTPKASRTDVHVTTIWRLEKLKPPDNLAEIRATGMELLKQYEPSDDEGGGRISQYVQHLTTRRIEPKDWGVGKMLQDINPLVAEVEKCLRPHAEAALPAVQQTNVITTMSASTAVVTITASAAVQIKSDVETKD